MVTPELNWQGGTERCLAEILTRWPRDFDLRLYTMQVDAVDLEGVEIVKIPRPPGPHLFRYVWWVLSNTLVRRRDSRALGPPDLVYSPGVNCLNADFMTVHVVFAKHWDFVRKQTLRDLRRPVTFLRTLHRIIYWTVIKWMERRVYSGPAGLVAISGWDAREIERRFRRAKGSVSVLHHGVDSEALSPERAAEGRERARERMGLAEQKAIFVFGNDYYRKGIDVAVRALARLQGDVVLLIRGSFDASPLWALARRLGVSDRVRILPPTEDVLTYYASADVVIAPSREDSFSLPPLEAIAAGVPVVVSRLAGVSEMFESGKHALVLENPEDAEDLAFQVRRILEDPELAKVLKHEGRALAELCTWENNANRTADLMRDRIAEMAQTVSGSD